MNLISSALSSEPWSCAKPRVYFRAAGASVVMATSEVRRFLSRRLQVPRRAFATADPGFALLATLLTLGWRAEGRGATTATATGATSATQLPWKPT